MAEYTDFSFMRPGGDDKGGKTIKSTAGLPAPTRQDTIDVVTQSEVVRRAIENQKANGKPMYVADTRTSRKKSMPVSQLSQKQANALEAQRDREARKQKQAVIDKKGMAQQALFPTNEYFKDLGPTRYEQREVENRVINPDIPMSLFDPRIQPDTVYQYKQVGGPDLVSVPGYSTRLLGKPAEVIQPVQRPPQRVPKQTYGPRVSFGTSNNRPTNQPGEGGRGGWWNIFQ
jgi:hypothetical protein